MGESRSESELVDSLLPGALRIADVCAAIKPGESVAIITDSGRDPAIANALAIATETLGGVPLVVSTSPVPSGAEPPQIVADAIAQAEVILAPTSGALYHTQVVQAAARGGARFLGLTGFIPEVLIRGGVFADFPELAPSAERLANLLSAASVARVIAPGGTDFSVRLDGRFAVPITGMARNPGERTGCPDIEAFIAPRETSAEGVVVVDASASIAGVLIEPIRIELRQGRAVSIDGGLAAQRINDALVQAATPSAFNLAELAFGLNPQALIRGVIVEDEGVAGTGHVALGSNIHFGGVSDAPLHLDFVYREPTLWLDDRLVFEHGVFLHDWK